MTKIILTRHGHVEGITPARFRGGELPLTDLGRAQAKAVAERISQGWRPAMIYASPLQRCIATAAAIAEACGLGYATLAELRDFDYGEFTGRTHEEVRIAAPDFFAAWQASPQWVRFPGGDSLQDVAARTADVLRLVIERHATETIVLVAHDSSSRALLLQLLNLPLSAYWSLVQEPCAINEIDLDDGHARVRRINETLHLESVSLS
jgi:phosphoserine phosphatase